MAFSYWMQVDAALIGDLRMHIVLILNPHAVCHGVYPHGEKVVLSRWLRLLASQAVEYKNQTVLFLFPPPDFQCIYLSFHLLPLPHWLATLTYRLASIAISTACSPFALLLALCSHIISMQGGRQIYLREFY